MEDGRLTDSQGRTVDFKNTVIIMTSNVGAKHLKQEGKAVGFNVGIDKERDDMAAKKLVLDEVKRIFRPEFINRIDELIVFKALGKEELVQIIDIMLKDVNKRLKEMQIEMEVTAEAKDVIIREGSDFTYGARPLKRAIQKLVEDEIAELLLKGEITKGDSLIVESQNEKLHFGRK